MKKNKHITVDEMKEIMREVGFTKPIGRIGNTNFYRISDNYITGEDGWVLFNRELKRQLKKMLESTKYKTYDFISLDIEGMELDVLPQMDLNKLGTKLICVEFNGKQKEKYDELIVPQGFNLISQNAENLMYAKK